ncbi:carbohydrate porin [Myxacorys almedinensis]|uniref:Porin n=1 Tax=Myxacorys almedinensis A TaxID=2690445 RepID=A0A8J7YXW7_9CYAN|nr:carbohydrate porin [Myxacorys almedinensis]NDJ16574.1 porin [Myxacorys almedinensis A]
MSELSRYTLSKYLLSIGAILEKLAQAVVFFTLFMPAVSAQENSHRPHESEPAPLHQRVALQEAEKLADLRFAEHQQMHLTEIAAVSHSAKAGLPQLQPTRSNVISEDDLIRQMSGNAAVSSELRPALSAPLPSRQPPTATMPFGNITKQPAVEIVPPALQRAAAQAQPRTTQPPPVLVTATQNSDVGLQLVETKPREYQFSAPTSGLRGVNPDAFTEPSIVPTPEVTAIDETHSKEGLLAQSSGYNSTSLRNRPFMRSTALTPPDLTFQGVYLYQGDQTSARARLTGTYPLSPSVLFGATLDLTTGNAFTDTPLNGFNVNELYIAIAPKDIPNLRFVVGQLDLTSYFDRNSFAKDGASHFFNPIFQTNPALSAAGIASRPGALVNFSLNDNIEAKAAVFSSSRGLSDFSLDGFAGELGIRYGNLIVRGTYASDRDSGSKTGFSEIFSLARGNNEFGVLKGDREEAYGVNAEYFIPNLKLGIFGRYGRYNNVDLGQGGDTFSAGITFLDLFTPDDRLGLAYGRGLSNDGLRLQTNDKKPDALELFYDFRFLQNLRVGFSIQERNDFSEIIAGVRIKTEFDVTPKGRPVQ